MPGVILNSPVPGPEKVGGFTCHGSVLFPVLLEQSGELGLSRVVLLGSK